MMFRANPSVDDAFMPENPENEWQPSPEPMPAAERHGTDAVLSAHEIALIRASVTVVAPHVAELPAYFYGVLFSRYPHARDLFPPEMDVQHDRLVRALLLIVDLVDDPKHLVRFCSDLGRDHRKFGTQSAHYAAVGECLLATLAHFAGPAWTEDIATAWTRAYTAVAQAMDQAAAADAAERPAVWNAQIVHHRAYGPGLAEITVRTDQPYAYTGGQFVSMETPWWPKIWRYFSPANAPRPDGTITFHVRAVPGGRISNALVHQASVGDVVRLGLALGDMVLDPTSTRDVVCVAGGTGIAPIRALVEQAALDGVQRRMELFVGARTANELHGLDDLLHMSRQHRWLNVRAAVSDEDAPAGSSHLLRVLAESGPWRHHDAYLSGPGPMMTAAGRLLGRGGVPLERFYYDPFVQLDVPDPGATAGPGH
ncbi:NAD(P)H-flavin reductase [Kitasatospora atroaurantiaca]|uniref:nitric oxide dioxygenase n=2 Tax=Kitasatospora atroaurantiaca TaxID=285545 RepID=A0A561EIY6_9ACTN|nr:NAD(P)H-flavin reductase [Kitasatospora atroaurantiaca]